MLVSQRSYYPHVRPPHALYPYVRPSHTPTFHHIPSDVPRFTVISHEGMHHREQPWDDLHELGIVGVCHLHEISEGGQLKPYLTQNGVKIHTLLFFFFSSLTGHTK